MYADTIEVLRPGPGSQDQWLSLYRGPADVQFEVQEVRKRRIDGLPEPSYDAHIFLPLTDQAAVLFDGGSNQVRQHDIVRVEPAVGANRTMRVEGVSPLDNPTDGEVRS